MPKIKFCWKVISYFVVHNVLQNTGTLSDKRNDKSHHNAIGWLPNYTIRIYNIGNKEHK